MGDNSGKVVAPVLAWLDAGLVNVSGECCITLPTSLIPFIVGAIEEYKLPDMWTGDDNDIIYAIKVFETLSAELSAVISNCGSSTLNCGCTSQCEDTSYMANKCVPLSIKDGKLYWNNGCEEIEIPGKLGETTGKEEIPDVEPTEPEPQADLRCLKANVVGEYIWRVSEAIRDCIDDTLPTEFINEVEKRANTQLDTPGMTGAWATYWTHKLLLQDYLATTLDTTKQSEFICQFSKVADGSTTAVSDKEMDRIHAAMSLTMSVDVIGTGFFNNVILAINKGRFERAIRMAQVAGMTFDCPCITVDPENIIPISEYTWSKVFDFTLGQYGFALLYTGNQRWELGKGYICDTLDGGAGNVPAIKRQWFGLMDTVAQVTYIKVFFASVGHVEGTGNWVPIKVGSVAALQGPASLCAADMIMINRPTGIQMGEGDAITIGENCYWYNQPSGFNWTIKKMIVAGYGDSGLTKINPDGSIT